MMENETVDTLAFDDPLAEKVDWVPAKGGGANFSTHKLVSNRDYRVEFHATMKAKLFYGVFLVVGLGVLYQFSISKILAGYTDIFKLDFLMTSIFGILFSAAGAAMLYFGTVPVVFDKNAGSFWKGRAGDGKYLDKKKVKFSGLLSDIHALQLISEHCEGDDSSYYSYELNLILGDGQRINVVDHGNKKQVRQETATLSAFLEKPVWDAI